VDEVTCGELAVKRFATPHQSPSVTASPHRGKPFLASLA